MINLKFQKLRQSIRLIHRRQIIRFSRLFDKAYYLANNPDVARSGIDPLNHFIQYGGSEGRDPGPYFSSSWYLTMYEDVKNSGFNPLVHYLSFGKKEKRKIMSTADFNQLALIRSSVFFDEEFYLANNPDVAKAQVDPSVHYLYYGGFEGRNPGATFSSKYYLDSYDDVKISGINPLVHYLSYGFSKNRHVNENHHFLNVIKDYNFSGSEFLHVVEKQKIIYEPQIINWNKLTYKIVTREGKTWLIKNDMNKDMIKREILIYLLSKDLVNLCEIRTLSDEDCQNLKNLDLAPSHAIPLTTLLVRLAQDYSLDELPLKTLDSSLAGELVLSLWIRRRDFTRWNHAYTKDGVIACFDMNASINTDQNPPGFVDGNLFFNNVNPGYPGYWRVRERKNEPLDNQKQRDIDEYHYHLINSRSVFINEIYSIEEKILRISSLVPEYAEKAGFFGIEFDQVISFFQTTTKTLPADVEKLIQVVFSDIPEC